MLYIQVTYEELQDILNERVPGRIADDVSIINASLLIDKVLKDPMINLKEYITDVRLKSKTVIVTHAARDILTALTDYGDLFSPDLIE